MYTHTEREREIEIQPSVDASYWLRASLPLHVSFFMLSLYMGYFGLLWSLVIDILEQVFSHPQQIHKQKESQV